MLLSVAGVTINQEYLIAITIKTTKDPFNNHTFSIIATLDSTKEEKEVTLVKNLSSYEMAEYIGEQIASIIASDCDSQMTKDELEGYISEYKEMEQEFLEAQAAEEEDSEESIEETISEQNSPIPEFIEIIVLDKPYAIVNKEKITTRVTPIFPSSPFGNTEYQLEWAVDGFNYEPLEIYKTKDLAETALRNFNHDLSTGQTRFDRQYFENFAVQRSFLFR